MSRWERLLGERGIAAGGGTARQRRVLGSILDLAEGDPRIQAVHLAGSLSRGEGDRFSDVDARLVAAPGHWTSLWDDRVPWVRALGEGAGLGPPLFTLDHQWDKVTDRLWYAALYPTCLYLDLYLEQGPRPAPEDGLVLWSRPIGSASEGRARSVGAGSGGAGPEPDEATGIRPEGCQSDHRPLESPPAVSNDPLRDTLELFWMGSALCANFALRGDLWQALEFLNSRRSLLMKAWRQVHRPDHAGWGWHSVGLDLPLEVLARLGKAVARPDAADISRALLVVDDLMLEVGPELARERGIDHPEGARAVRDMLGTHLALRYPTARPGAGQDR